MQLHYTILTDFMHVLIVCHSRGNIIFLSATTDPFGRMKLAMKGNPINPQRPGERKKDRKADDIDSMSQRTAIKQRAAEVSKPRNGNKNGAVNLNKTLKKSR
jgi:hypothetical protein